MNRLSHPFISNAWDGFSRLSLLIVALALFSGCAWLVKPPASDPAALEQLERWSAQNRHLTRLKGIMHVKMHIGQERFNSRMAWASVMPDRLRIEWLSTLGQPVYSMAADGRTVYVNQAGEEKVHCFKQSGASLQRLIKIPLAIEDLLQIILGQPPLPDFEAAQLHGQGCSVVLKNRWDSPLAVLTADPCDQLRQFRRLHADGTLSYEVTWISHRENQQHSLPEKITVTTGDGNDLTLALQRVWTDIAIPADMFVLQSK
ncbi:MAG: DUF4292 domain-containing protein [Desulfatitalea sp.]|nr:DUF4292 domain-containing protein [Desulfatitalea sp.]NNK01985.1 DUF4292 domain-containing protein [Desulfatitalea sp.]